MIARRLRETLPVQPQKWQKQDVAVALGAGLQAHYLWDRASAPGSVGAGQTASASGGRQQPGAAQGAPTANQGQQPASGAGAPAGNPRQQPGAGGWQQTATGQSAGAGMAGAGWQQAASGQGAGMSGAQTQAGTGQTPGAGGGAWQQAGPGRGSGMAGGWQQSGPRAAFVGGGAPSAAVVSSNERTAAFLRRAGAYFIDWIILWIVMGVLLVGGRCLAPIPSRARPP